MRALLVSALFTAPLLATGLPAAAQEPPRFPPITEGPAVETAPSAPLDETVTGPAPAAPAPQSLDDMFTELKRESSPERADAIAGRIRDAWLRSGSDTVDLLLGWAAQSILKGETGTAFDLLEQAIVLEPDYAEAWNARATLNYQLEEYGRSLADIEQTLRREPRHFGALAGLAAILEQMERPQQALEAYRRVLEIYPAMRPAQDAVGRLTAELRGQAL